MSGTCRPIDPPALRRAPPVAEADASSSGATGGVAGLCARKRDLVHIEPKNSGDPPDTPDTFEEVDADGSRGLLDLDRRVDLNGDGNPEWVFAAPAAAARDARYLLWFTDCGNGAFYPLFREYAAEYEIAMGAANGWRLIYFFNNMSPEKPSFTIVKKDTYRFDGSYYVLTKSEKVKHPID